MPIINNYAEFINFLGPWEEKSFFRNGKNLLRHIVFKRFCAAYEPHSFIATCCIQIFKAKPDKRKAIFIYETFIEAGIGTNLSASAAGSNATLLDGINLGGGGGNMSQDQLENLRDRNWELTQIKTFGGKRKAISQTIKREVAPEMFASLEASIIGGFHGLFGGFNTFKTGIDTNQDTGTIPGHYSTSFADARNRLESVGFSADAIGVWGGA